jgi:PKD repeat protein
MRPRKFTAGALTGALVFVGLVLVAAPVAASPLPDVTFTASADAYAAEATPTVAKGTTDVQNCFVNDDSPSRQVCYVAFTVSGLGTGDSVTGAQVLMRTKGNSTAGKTISLSAVSAGFTESTVTWNNRPAVGSVLATVSSLAFKTDAVFNIGTGTVTANGTYTFAVWGAPGSMNVGTNFYAKENVDGQPGPRLKLQLDHQSPPVAVLEQPAPVDEDTSTTLTAVNSTDPDNDIASYDWDFGDGTTPVVGAAWWFIDHTYANPGTYPVTVTVRDSGGRTSIDTKSIVVNAVTPPPPVLRYPGDPGPGNQYHGLNNEGTFNAVQAQMPHSFGTRRSYNGNNWGVPNTAVAADIAAGRVPMVSWKFAPYTVSTVPQSAIDQVCTDLASYAPHPIMATIFHEPTGDITGTADRDAYRALQRQTILSCRTAGVTNVAWMSPLFEGPFAFTTGSGHSWSELYADCLAGCSTASPTWATGSARVYDLDGIDIYVSRTIDSRPFTTQMSVVTNAMTAAGLTPLPWAIGELGVHAGYTSGPADPLYRQREMNATWTALQGNPAYAAVNWWNTGGESFCHGATPASDQLPAACAAEQILATIIGDPTVVHP